MKPRNKTSHIGQKKWQQILTTLQTQVILESRPQMDFENV
ncbi:hypothetical protein M7I_2353 [Glarea lozoyensis 74030]|uniref:Uncharacterized protein n=1 Tax=Glarea lozoyensis (strain ATCC 74030 / MF5533) TaxID=1104152 RepID=H0EIJ4_GLAL7|nr:hypothetical protein M7I_2353 [Glarea lozoyensis 74030]